MLNNIHPLRGFFKIVNFVIYRNYENNEQKTEPRLLSSAIVLYDHACPLCRKEMQRLKARDRHGRLLLLDINSADFDESDWGVTRHEASQALHVLTAQDQWLWVCRLSAMSTRKWD